MNSSFSNVIIHHTSDPRPFHELSPISKYIVSDRFSVRSWTSSYVMLDRTCLTRHPILFSIILTLNLVNIFLNCHPRVHWTNSNIPLFVIFVIHRSRTHKVHVLFSFFRVCFFFLIENRNHHNEFVFTEFTNFIQIFIHKLEILKFKSETQHTRFLHLKCTY